MEERWDQNDLTQNKGTTKRQRSGQPGTMSCKEYGNNKRRKKTGLFLTFFVFYS